MKPQLIAIFALTLSTALLADDGGTLLFEDDFNRSESQEIKDEVGEGWKTNSASRAGGNKQVDLKNGAMYIFIHPTADHGVSVTHPAEFRDGRVELRFMLEDEKDRLGLNFADLEFKEVHAGHLYKVDVGTDRVQIEDLKTGAMKLEHREARLAGKLTDAQKKLIATKRKTFPVELKTGKWYGLEVRIVGDTATAFIDGKKIGSFSSEGIAHPTKRLLRLAVPRNAVVDDVRIYRLSPHPEAAAAAASDVKKKLTDLPGDLPEPLIAFMEQHCHDCHDADISKGDLNLADLAFNPAVPSNLATWQRVFERVRNDEMPPAKKRRPDAADRASFLAGLERPLVAIDRADIEANGRVRSRRLTRVEYEHTLHDLLGIDIPLKDMLPEDPATAGFETVARGQQLSHYQLARYLDVADLALEEAFTRALEGDADYKKFLTPDDLARRGRGNYRGPDLRDGESISWPLTLQFFGRMTETEVPADGWYRITLRDVRAINPGEDGAVWGTLRSGSCYSDAPILYMIGLVEATPEPRDLVFEAWIQEDHMLELKPNDAVLRRPATGAKGGNVSFEGRDLEADGYSGIAHRGIEMERIYPNADRDTVRRNLFGDVNADSQAGAAELENVVRRFATRAFRRPVTDDQLEPYLALGLAALQEGRPFAQALRASYRAILCSPRFLTFVEEPGRLDEHAIASRLSYSLWVSMPDAQLTKLADAGKLDEPKVLAAQIERMLEDPKFERFIRSFTDQWLKLKEIDFTSPDTRRYRNFDPTLQESMVQETRSFIRHLIQTDAGITNLVDSEFTFVNGRLARHYELIDDNDRDRDDDKDEADAQTADASPLPITPGNGTQKVAVPDDLPRGGLLTQGAILKVTADGSITSPVVRGVFVNERILGQHIPPPPPNLPAIEPDIRGAVSIRDQLEKHRADESCASCHKLIDPPGFALESFDPIGGWRTRYGRDDDSAHVDPAGITPDGKEFDDLAGWKAIYNERGDQLATNFVRQFLTYATGATIRLSDQRVVEKIVDEAKESDYGVQSLMSAALTSQVFLQK